MKKNKLICFLSVSPPVFFAGFMAVALADHESHKEDDGHHRALSAKDGDHDRDKDNVSDEKGGSTRVINEEYKTTCGECHLAYPPEFLPTLSWEKILNRLEDHFGENLSIDPGAKGEVGKYLMENAADRSSSKRAKKIIRGLDKQPPIRITELPYIREKHHEISSEVLKRKAIGSLSNCTACHRTAEQGDFDDDRVEIPK